MTAIVGVLCTDGVVIGADSAVTMGPNQQFRTIEQPIEKIEVIDGKIIVAGCGSVGLNQRFCDIIRARLGRTLIGDNSEITGAKSLTKAMIEDLKYTYLNPGDYAAFVAFPCKRSHHLCEFQQADLQPEFKTERLWYGSLGCTQPITDSFLGLIREVFWQDGPPNLNGGLLAVTWTLHHAVKVNPGGVNGPIRIAVLERREGTNYVARLLSEDELGEHHQNVENIITYIREYPKHLEADATRDIAPPTLATADNVVNATR